MSSSENNRSGRFIGIVEARMTSSRLPGKMMKEIGGKPSLQVLIERLACTKQLDAIVVATTSNASDAPLEALCNKLGVGCFRGSEEDVLGRVLCAARAFRADVIVEITGDCTLIDPEIVDHCISVYKRSKAGFVANCVRKPHYPPGMDARIFSMEMLTELDRITTNPDDREHVSLYFWEHPEKYGIEHVCPPAELCFPDLYIALDEMADLEMIRLIYDALVQNNPVFTLREIIDFIHSHPEATVKSQMVHRKGSH